METEDVVEDDQNVLRSEASFFAEWDFVKLFIKEICTNEWENIWNTKWEYLTSILLVFQEQPSLLSPYLEEIVIPLTSKLINILQQEQPTNLALKSVGRFQRMESVQFHAICKVLQLFCRVRGYKYIIKFFPHEVSHVEVCMIALQSQDYNDYQNWETRYILLLWMCQLCLIPFDICSLDSTLNSVTTTDDDNKISSNNDILLINSSITKQSRLVCDIISIGRKHLSESGPTREAAYACLSVLLTRPDMESILLGDFMKWCCERLEAWVSKGEKAENELNRESFQLIGMLHTMSQIFKKGHRNNILPYATMALNPCLLLTEQNNQTLVRKLLIKVIQRIGLMFLPPREAAWRYQRGSRSLLSNLNQSTGKSIIDIPKVNELKEEDNDEEDVDVPAELEDVIEKVLCALQDKDTVVRWSAAKGIGRITMRLPLDFGDDVVGAVIGIFSDPENECAWHGGCLALAELSRRGLLLPERLETVVPIIVHAMHFDLLRGQHSVGSHVRDAASYVCWAFARAYAPDVLRPFVSLFSEAMLLASLFDREINCRRAASAAFQENVGRQGNENFPHGIEVIAVADYFSLGNRSNAYLTIAPIIAKLSPTFHQFIVEHLWKNKISHWDSDIRLLAAKALGKLTEINPLYSLNALQPILESCINPTSSVTTRHGGVLAVAEIILTLSMNNKMSNVENDFNSTNTSSGTSSGSNDNKYDLDEKEVNVIQIPENIITDTFELVGKLDKGRMYRGRGGEQLREASCILIENVARSQLSMPIKVQVALVEMLHENLRQPHEHIQRASVRALRQMLFSYFPITTVASERLQKLTVLKYLEGIKSDLNIAVVRGYTLALGVLPAKLLRMPEGRLKEVFNCLETVMSPSHRIAGEPDAEIRRNAVESIAELAERLVPSGCFELDDSDDNDENNNNNNNNNSSSKVSIKYVLNLLQQACDDYSIDKRGDTGSWSRVLGMKGLERFVFAVLRSSKYSPLLLRHPEAKFSNMIESSGGSSGIKVGSHVLTAGGHAIVVNIDTLISNTILVHYPPESVGSVLNNSNEIKEFSIKLNKEIILLGQSSNDSDSSIYSDEIGDHFSRQVLIDNLNSQKQNSNNIEEEIKNSEIVIQPLRSVCSLGEAEMQEVVGIILKQLGEKLDIVREVAGNILERLINSTDPFVIMIPDKMIIQDCLKTLKSNNISLIESSKQMKNKDMTDITQITPNTNVINWTQSNFVYTFLVELLDSKYYFDNIISGMIISIGGLSEDVVKESLSALLKWCLNKKSTKNLRDLGYLSNAVITIFYKYQRNSRVTIPLMKCICSLLRNGVFDFLHNNTNNVVSGEFGDKSVSFGVNLLRAVVAELNNCGELIKIRSGVDIYLLLILFEDPVRPQALKSLLMLLGHKYPKVRKYTAEQLYVQFISDSNAVGCSASDVKVQLENIVKQNEENKNSRSEEEVVALLRSGFATTQEVLDSACDVLVSTVWDDDLEVARNMRNKLCNILGVNLNIKVKADTSSLKKSSNEKKVDDLDSYDSLVREAGY